MYKKVKCATGFVRVWTDNQLQELVEFKSLVKPGRTGKMGKYKGKGTKNGKKENILFCTEPSGQSFFLNV